jgi:general secretion pathway protein G
MGKCTEQAAFKFTQTSGLCRAPRDGITFCASKGYTIFELLVVICVISLLLITFFHRVQFYQEHVEKAKMIGVVVAIQDALLFQQGRLLASGDDSGFAAIVTENPVSLLAEKPDNYAGEFYDPAAGALVRGKWVFDLKTRDLIYLPEHEGHLTIAGKGESKWLRYRVTLKQRPEQGKPARKIFTGITFEPVEVYRWEI